MRILFVTNQVPYPPDNGVRIVSYNAMTLMKDLGHELALAVLTVETETDNVSKRYNKIKSFCKDECSFMMSFALQNSLLIQFRAFFHNKMFPVERYNNKLFRIELDKLIKKFEPDVVHFDIITMCQYRDVVPPGVGTVASINDSYSLTLENLFSSMQYSGLQYLYRKYQYYQSKRYERSAYEAFDTVHVMADVDAKYLYKLNHNIITTIIPNGVYSELFNISKKTFTQTDVIFVASITGENLRSLKKFISESWPLIHTEFPDVKLYIVGKISENEKPVEKEFNNVGGIIFSGYVERLEKLYELCGIAIVPINKNCGILNKAIEAMASGLAVVGFDKSFSGIQGAKKNTHYVSVCDYENMGRAVVNLLHNTNLCQKIKTAAHLLAVDNYSWSNRIGDYEKMYLNASEHAASCTDHLKRSR